MASLPLVQDVLDRLTTGGGRPAITWYDVGGERVELSGAVLANWAAKTTNLLVEEFDVAPGSLVRVDLPAHWRSLVWALAAWRCGAGVVAGPGDHAAGDDDADVVVTDHPERHTHPQLVAVALPALARRFDGPLPAGAVDAAQAVMTYGDTIGWAPQPRPEATALLVGDERIDHAGLAGWARAEGTQGTDASAPPPGGRVLLEPGPDRTGGLASYLRAALGVLATGGSLVVVGPELADELRADPARRRALLATERVTAGA